MSLDTSDVVRDVEITFCSGGRAKNGARRSLEPNRYSLGFPPHLMGVPKGKKSGTFVVDSFQKNASKRAADPGGLKRLQELDDGFLVLPLQFFKLLTYMACLAAVPQDRVAKRRG